MWSRVESAKAFLPAFFRLWGEMSRKPVSDETIEIIKATFAETGSIRAAARAAKCSVSTASKYTDPTVRDQFERIRTEKRIDIIEALAAARITLLNAMVDPDALKKASLHEKAVAFGVVTDKHQLLTGEATERHEHRDANQAREALARRIDELAERRRTRGDSGNDAGERSG